MINVESWHIKIWIWTESINWSNVVLKGFKRLKCTIDISWKHFISSQEFDLGKNETNYLRSKILFDINLLLTILDRIVDS